jgi:hypothetical protein
MVTKKKDEHNGDIEEDDTLAMVTKKHDTLESYENA